MTLWLLVGPRLDQTGFFVGFDIASILLRYSVPILILNDDRLEVIDLPFQLVCLRGLLRVEFSQPMPD